MAKNDTSEVVETSAAPEVDVTALTAKVAEAQAKLDTVQAGFNEAAGDLTKMLAFADSIKTAKREHEKAVADLARATYSLRAAERIEFSAYVKEQVESFVAQFEQKARELSLTGIHIVYGPEGGTQVSVTDSSRPPGKATVSRSRTPGSGVSADNKNRGLWALPDGRTFTSRKLIELFGDEVEPGYGVKALDRADNWAAPRWGPNGNEPMKAGPGFNAALLRIAEKIGATR